MITFLRASRERSGGVSGTRWAVWAGLIAVAFGVGAVLRVAGALPVDALPPLHAHARLLVIPLIPAAVLGAAGVVALPIAARRLRWPWSLAIAWAASVAWAVALQAPDGLSRPLTNRADYLAGLPAMGDDPLGWLRGFTTHLREYPTHVKGHPPLPMLILWILRWTNLAGAGWAAAFVIAFGASSAAAIAITVRAVAGEPTARRALPFLALSPTAIWVATSMDAVFLGASAWGVALLTRAAVQSGREGPRPPWGAIPLLWSRVVDGGDKGFHKLWITLGFVPKRASRARAAFGRRLAYPTRTGDAILSPRLSRTVKASGWTVAHVPDLGNPSTLGILPILRALPAPASSPASRNRPAPDGPPGIGGRTAPGGPPIRPRTRLSPATVAGAFVAGLLVGSLPYLSYGLVTILALPLAVLVLTRPPRTLVLTFGLGCLVVPVAFAFAGFLWWDGVVQTHAAWSAGAGAQRPYAYFLIGDLAVLALVIGPAAAHALPGLLRPPRRQGNAAARLGVLVGAVLLGVVALDVSGVTRGEVERIWLPYAAWMTAGAAVHPAPARRMLLAQIVTALLIQALVRSPW